MRAVILVGTAILCVASTAEGHRNTPSGVAASSSVAGDVTASTETFRQTSAVAAPGLTPISAMDTVNPMPPAGAALLGGLGLFFMAGGRKSPVREGAEKTLHAGNAAGRSSSSGVALA